MWSTSQLCFNAAGQTGQHPIFQYLMSRKSTEEKNYTRFRCKKVAYPDGGKVPHCHIEVVHSRDTIVQHEYKYPLIPLLRLTSIMLTPHNHVSHREYRLLCTNALLGRNNNLQSARLPPALSPSPLTRIPSLFCLHPTTLCIHPLLLIRIAFMATNSTENGLPSSPKTITSVNHTRPQARSKAQFSGTSPFAYQDSRSTSSTTHRTPISAILSVSP